LKIISAYAKKANELNTVSRIRSAYGMLLSTYRGDKMVRVAINGFGRIGRLVLRAGINDRKIQWVAVNDLTDAVTLAHLFKYDSVHGKFDGTVKTEGNSLVINRKKIAVLAEKEPEKLPWRVMKVDVVVESTGRFTSREDCEKHIRAGAKKVLLSAPSKGDKPIPTFCIGANEQGIKKAGPIISNASCTTNSLVPLVNVLDKNFGIKYGFMTTAHSYTADQNLVDGPHKDLRRARAAAINIVPTTTGAAKAIGEVFPHLKGKLDGIAIRVPTPNSSFTDLTVVVNKDVTLEQINDAMKKAANSYLKNVLEYSEEPLVSTDIIGNPNSSIFDAQQTRVIDKRLVKVCAWYDNEWGYSVRMVDMLKLM